MSETPPLTPLNADARLDQLFPTVTSEQLARISEQGTRRELQAGQVVYEAGVEEVPFVVVTRAPLALETSRPGVFAVGDVRSGSMKRVASAVGEGADAVALVHEALQQ